MGKREGGGLLGRFVRGAEPRERKACGGGGVRGGDERVCVRR